MTPMKNNVNIAKMVNNILFFSISLGLVIYFFPTKSIEHLFYAKDSVKIDLQPPLQMKAQPIELAIDLEGKWKFNTGDDPLRIRKEYDDANWDEIYVPGYWEHQGYSDYNGFAWYRKWITIDEELASQKLVLLLGKIDDIDQVYINGQLVGETGEGWNREEVYVKGTEWQELRGYYLPDDIFESGDNNLISMRVYDGMIDGGVHEGPIGLVTQDTYIAYWTKKKQRKDKRRF